MPAIARAALLLLAVLASCAEHVTPDYRWVGPVTPKDPACPASRGVALLRNGNLTFAPDEGTWVLIGTATPDGKMEADKERPAAKSTTYATHLEGTWSRDRLAGTYTTPRCAYTVDLRRY